MAKKKSLKAKLAKRAKSSADSPNAVDPEPSTSKATAEQTPKVFFIILSASWLGWLSYHIIIAAHFIANLISGDSNIYVCNKGPGQSA